MTRSLRDSCEWEHRLCGLCPSTHMSTHMLFWFMYVQQHKAQKGWVKVNILGQRGWWLINTRCLSLYSDYMYRCSLSTHDDNLVIYTPGDNMCPQWDCIALSSSRHHHLSFAQVPRKIKELGIDRHSWSCVSLCLSAFHVVSSSFVHWLMAAKLCRTIGHMLLCITARIDHFASHLW